jgi:hypothetical protein
MEHFRELQIKVDSENSADFILAVNAALTGGWSRAWEAERRAEAMDSLTDEEFYFCCDKREKREAALLAIYRKDAERQQSRKQKVESRNGAAGKRRRIREFPRIFRAGNFNRG